MVSVSSTRDLSSMVGNFSESLKWAPSRLPQIFLPIKDSVGEGLVVPVTWPCFDNTTFIGMVGLDIHLADIAEDVTYFTEEKNAYAFLINDKGNVVFIMAKWCTTSLSRTLYFLFQVEKYFSPLNVLTLQLTLCVFIHYEDIYPVI